MRNRQKWPGKATTNKNQEEDSTNTLMTKKGNGRESQGRQENTIKTQNNHNKSGTMTVWFYFCTNQAVLVSMSDLLKFKFILNALTIMLKHLNLTYVKTAMVPNVSFSQ